MDISRKELLGRLLAISCGLSKADAPTQSSCFIFKNGWAYTMNREIACAIPIGLPKEVRVAVRAEKLLELLRHLKSDELGLDITDSHLLLKDLKLNSKSKLVLEEEILLPVNAVERPSEEGWLDLNESFGEAIDLCSKCTKKQEEWLKSCIHITPTYVEASDNDRLLRYNLSTFVTKPSLTRATSIKAICDLGMSKAAETDSWLHFRNKTGLRVSVLKYEVSQYPDLSEFLETRGEPVSFPKSLGEIAKRAQIMAEEEQGVRIKVLDGQMSVEGRNVEGEHEEIASIEYDGPSMTFAVPAKIIGELVSKHNACEVTPCSLRVETKNYVYAASLGALEPGEEQAWKPN